MSKAVAEVLFRKDDDGHFVASNVSDVATGSSLKKEWI
mgnify:FL=1